MADPLLPQDDLLASTMTHQAPKPNYAAGLEARISQAAGPSWLEQASAEHQRAGEAFQQGGPKALLALDPGPTLDLAGMFAGPGAITADKGALAIAQRMLANGESEEAIWKATGWFQGKDAKWRFEISDRPAIYNHNIRGNTVGEQLHHPRLFEAYPYLADIPVLHEGRGAGYFSPADPYGERIRLPGNPSYQDRVALLHEIMHAIQNREGFAKGGHPAAIKPIARQVLGNDVSEQEINKFADEAYRRLAGEVESRNVEYRDEYGDARAPFKTEDRPREKQTVIGLTPVEHDPFEGKSASTTPLGRTFWSSASVKTALRLFNEAKTAGKATEEAYQFVSEKTGRSPQAIKHKFRSEGAFTPTDRADWAYARSNKPVYEAQPGFWKNPDNDAKLETLFKKGMSFDDIARELKTSRGAVAGRLQRRGLLGQAASVEDQFRNQAGSSFVRTEPGMRKPSAPAPSKLPMMSDADIRAGESIQRYLLTPVEHDPFKDEK